MLSCSVKKYYALFQVLDQSDLSQLDQTCFIFNAGVYVSVSSNMSPQYNLKYRLHKRSGCFLKVPTVS